MNDRSAAVCGRLGMMALLVQAVGLVPAAWAQEAPASKDAQAMGEIVVTGTRIRRSEEDFANPVVAISAEAIERSGRTNLADLLTKSPALLGSQVGDQTGGSGGDVGLNYGETGVNLLNLRNLGVDRTLVLVDGRRHVSGIEGSAAVDINSIPTDLVESVDVLTGGASAIYGADGVSGVVNFRLKKNFDGVSLRGQVGTSGYNDGANRFVALTVGHNFADMRGNVALAIEMNVDDRVNDQRRPWLRRGKAGNLFRNQADIPDDPNIPDNVPYYDTRYADSATAGAVDVDAMRFQIFWAPGRCMTGARCCRARADLRWEA